MKNTQRPTPKIPEGMVELLKNLAKSVLKEQPENIYAFAAEYFENLVRQRDGNLDKGYLTFRKYDDEIPKQDGFVCPRCNYVLHPERKEVDSANGDDEGVSPKNEDTNGLDMSVNGVAIKAVPRDGKTSKGSKNRQRLETIRSVSMDSAIEDDGKSQATSPKSNENAPVKSVDRHLSVPNINALKPINVNGVSIPAKIQEEGKSDKEQETASESSTHDVPVEPTSGTTTNLNEDDIDLSANGTSASEINTDRTVIEVAPKNTEGKTETEITTVITEPTDEQTVTVEQTDQIKNVNNLHLDQVKQMDQRLRTPESDSGLSEKSFNLNIQENEDAVTAERNQIKDGNVIDKNQTDSSDPSHQDPPNGKDFDTESKDDSGIVEFEENPNENDPEEMTNENENRENVESANNSADQMNNSVTIQSPDDDKIDEHGNDNNQNLDQDAKQTDNKENVAANETTTEQKSEHQPERPNAIALHTNLKPHELVEQYHKSPDKTSKTFEDHVLNHMKATSPMASDESAPNFENEKLTMNPPKIAPDDRSDLQENHPKMSEDQETEITPDEKGNKNTNDPKCADEKKFPEKSVDENQFPVEACDLTQQKSTEEKDDKVKNESEMKKSGDGNDIKSPNEPQQREKRETAIENDVKQLNNDGNEKSREGNTDSDLNATSETSALNQNKESEMKKSAQNDVKNESTVTKSSTIEKNDILNDENNSKIENENDSGQPKQSKSEVVESNENTKPITSNSQNGKDETNALGSTKSEKPETEQKSPEIASNVSSDPKTTNSVEKSEANQTKNEAARSGKSEKDVPNEDHKSPSVEKNAEQIKSEDLANKSQDVGKDCIEKAKEEKSVEDSKVTKPNVDKSSVVNESDSQDGYGPKTDERSDKIPSDQLKSGISPSSEQSSAENVTENDDKETEMKSGKQSANEKSELQLDLNGQDEISDDVYITPPDTSNDNNSPERTKSSEKISSEPDADVIKNEIEVTSKVDSPANKNANELNTSKSNDIENGNLNSVKPENGHLVDEVKESQTAAKYDENRLGGVNESNSEKSAMPADGVNLVENKAKENQGTLNNNNENIYKNNNNNNDGMNQTSNENENLGKNMERKISIEQEQSNKHENENDDAGSELSESAKDEYEKAETEIVGDESVKDLDLSSTNDLDANLANESAESEQQITALEMPQQNDNDSIDSSPKQHQQQPDSLDMLADSNIDSLDVSLEPSVEADSLNIDSFDEKSKSAKSTGTRDSTDSNRHESIDRYDEKDSTDEKLKHDNHGNDNDDNDNKSHAQSTTDQATNKHPNKLDVSTANNDTVVADQTAKVMGDIVDSQQKTDTMHDQMRSELEVLRLAENSASIVMMGIEEVNSPKSLQPNIVDIEVKSTLEPVKDENKTTSDEKTGNVEIIQKVETIESMDKPEKQATEINNDIKDAAEIQSNAEPEQTIEIIIENRMTETFKEDTKIIDDAAKFSQTVEVVIENQSTTETKNETEQKGSDESEIKGSNSSISEEKPAAEIVHSIEMSGLDNEIGDDNLQQFDSQNESSDLMFVEEKRTEEMTQEAKVVESSEKTGRNSAEKTSLNNSNSDDSGGKEAEEKLEKKPLEQSKSESRTSVEQFNADLMIEKETEKPETDQLESKSQINQETNHEMINERNLSREESLKDDESMNAVDLSIVTEITIEQTIETDDQTEMIETSLTVLEVLETERSEEAADTEPLTCVEYLKPISNDTPSSDLSDTDTTDKAEIAYTESGVDETSRDERDEMSEIENFDLSSCGEDSLEAMYYMIRKNEIIMDRHKQTTIQICEEEKILFPEKATDDLEHAVREVSGKKITLCSIGSMNNSSTDDVVLKKLSSDSDEIQLHVIPNSEIDSSSSDLKSCPLKEEEQCTANESTDDEYMNPILDSMRKNDDNLNEMQAKALSVQPNRSDSQSDDQQQTETDTFNEHLMDDMMRGNIERKILASSVSEADSDYFEMPPTTSRLTKDDFNVSTAFEHMIRAESTTEDSDSTIESAATKIQATARGFITRRRLRRSSAGTSASVEKRSSIGNAAIDKSLDNLIEQQEMLEENVYSESFEESPAHSREMLNDPTIDSIDSDNVLGITEIKVEQRKDDTNKTGNYDDNDDDNNDYANAENVPGINIQGVSEESATAQRRLMLQRGDAMQRNDTPESSEQQHQHQQKPQQMSDKGKSKSGEHLPPNEIDNNGTGDNEHVKTPTKTTSKPFAKALRALGPRQRSMPVQIDTQVMRVLPKRSKKRVQSANSSSSKPNVKRPQLF